MSRGRRTCLPSAPTFRARAKRWGGHFFHETAPGLYLCACGVECMVVVRLADDYGPTFRAFNLYRHPLLTTTARARGLLRAKGWSTWTPLNPSHRTRLQRRPR